MADLSRAWARGKASKSARISFATPELLWQVLNAKRRELLKALCGAGPVSIREAARRVNRDVKAVHGDVTALLSAGVLNRAEESGVEFAFQAVKVEFLLQAAQPIVSRPFGGLRCRLAAKGCLEALALDPPDPLLCASVTSHRGSRSSTPNSGSMLDISPPTAQRLFS